MVTVYIFFFLHFHGIFLSSPAEGRGEPMLAALDIPLWSCHYSASLLSFPSFFLLLLNNLIRMTQIALKGRLKRTCIYTYIFSLPSQFLIDRKTLSP